ncbi:MAG: DUF11 domain-containing protein [Thermoanaerobaculia bacterium]
MKKAVLLAVMFVSSSVLHADISITDRSSTLRFLADPSILRPANKPAADRAARQAAKKEKREARRLGNHQTSSALSFHPRATATGSLSLTDVSGLKYFINTDITFSTTKSASGAASSASYIGPVAATTSLGGTTMSALDDMFDGYGGLCVSLTNATGPCDTGDAAYAIYNQTGSAPVFDATVPPGSSCTNRQLTFPVKTIGPLSVSRKVFVPNNDTYIRWMNFFTNTSGAPVTFTMITANNLGSDPNTIIVNSSNGDAVAQTTDTWISSFQNYSLGKSSDVRIGHVLQGTGAPTPVSNIFFVNGNDRPHWAYSITLAPGQTKMILDFATGQASKAAANAKAAALALLPASSTQCMSATELSQVVNFATSTDLSITKNTAAPTAFGGNPITYTLAVSNLGPSPANAVSVTDTLPAGSTFVSASGAGWTCNNAAGVVTCTVPTLPTGGAPVINLTIIAPQVASAGTLSNTATVSSATTDTNPANNSSTKNVPILPGSQIPALSTTMLMLLAAMLAVVALARRM